MVLIYRMPTILSEKIEDCCMKIQYISEEETKYLFDMLVLLEQLCIFLKLRKTLTNLS